MRIAQVTPLIESVPPHGIPVDLRQSVMSAEQEVSGPAVIETFSREST
jgi:hypothetical protein